MSSIDTMTSVYPAFQADDTLVEIIPAFDVEDEIPAHSTIPMGPFKAGMATVVPLWMAIFLHQRSLATICPPVWWTISNLSSIVSHEKKEEALFNNPKRLPDNYFEISKRLTSTTKAVVENHLSISLLVQDLLDIRLDKLRQQFVGLLKNGESTDVMVAVTGIGTQELALLRGFVSQALADQYYLARQAPVDTTDALPSGNTEKPSAVLRDKLSDEATDAAPAPTTRRSKLSLRRFRNTTTDPTRD